MAPPKKKKGGKKKKGAKSAKGDKGSSAEPKLSQVERFVKFSVATRADQIKKWRDERDRTRQENIRIGKQLEQLHSTQTKTVQQLRAVSTGDSTKLIDVEKDLAAKLEDAAREQEAFILSGEAQIMELRASLADVEERIAERSNYLQDLQIFQVVGQEENEHEIEALEREKQQLIDEHNEMLQDVTQRFAFARKRFAANLEARVERTRELAAENALFNQNSRDRMAAAEREWLKREVEVHHEEADKMQHHCDNLEAENLKLLSALVAEGIVPASTQLESLQAYVNELEQDDDLNGHRHNKRIAQGNGTGVFDARDEDEEEEEEDDVESTDGLSNGESHETADDAVSSAMHTAKGTFGRSKGREAVEGKEARLAHGQWTITSRGAPQYVHHQLSERELAEVDKQQRAQQLKTFANLSLMPARSKKQVRTATSDVAASQPQSSRVQTILELTKKANAANAKKLASLAPSPRGYGAPMQAHTTRGGLGTRTHHQHQLIGTNTLHTHSHGKMHATTTGHLPAISTRTSPAPRSNAATTRLATLSSSRSANVSF